MTAYAPRLPRLGTLGAWRDAARRLVAARVPPEAVDWALDDAPAPLFGDAVGELPAPARALRVSRAFPALLETLIPERAGEGLAVAYALLLRLQDAPGLLENRADPWVARAEAIAKAVRRDRHKMHAFVRFRELPLARDRRAFTAWFEPDHRIEELATPFFARRFADMDWEIVTPEVVTTFTGGALAHVARDTPRPSLGDPMEGLWTTYYSSIFNPARLKPAAMRAEMPKKYWRNLPEAQAIPHLIETAHARAEAMRLAAPTLPPPQALRRHTEDAPMKMHDQNDLFAGSQSLADVAANADACTRCALHEHATQTVFGEGPRDADVMFVGEQPGDREDLAGRPFVGPAGQLFDRVAGEAQLDRGALYVTNAVKHFKFEQRGRRRIHQKPAASEVSACRWWLDEELRLVDPRLVVAMGATALHALTGNGGGILKRRGGVERTRDGRPCLVTVHPSYLLRLPDEDMKARETAAFRRDLERVHDLLAEMDG